MAISVRTRFEVFKRDEFTCQYCGKKSPGVVLEVDHIVPVCDGGQDDVVNLRTSCWGCNRGKAGVPLSEIITGQDPHERAVLLLERERQLREYNAVLSTIRERVVAEHRQLCDYWRTSTRRRLSASDETWLENSLELYPSAEIRKSMSVAIRAKKVDSLAYVNAILKNSHKRGGF